MYNFDRTGGTGTIGSKGSRSNPKRKQREFAPITRVLSIVSLLLLAASYTTYLVRHPLLDSGGTQRLASVARRNAPPYGHSSNRQTRALLELQEMALYTVDSAILPWPSYLKLHKGSNDTLPNVSSCIVTAYFQIKSKHSSSDYDKWMQNILSLKDCMVIFCEADMVETILRYRNKNYERLTAVIEVQLTDLPMVQHFYPSASDTSASDFWQRQLSIDPEQRIHQSYQVFWIWLSKSWFVTTVALLQNQLFSPAQATHTIDIWMWADIGSFRDRKYNNKQLIHANVVDLFPDRDTVLWMAHRTPSPPTDPFWNQKLVKEEKHHFYQSGSQAVAASVSAWTTFHARFVETLDRTAAQGLFVGEDQIIIQTTCMLYPSSCAYIPFDQVPDNKYFGLRYVLHHGGDGTKSDTERRKPFQLWRPLSPSMQ
jgi:hypothetical protein